MKLLLQALLAISFLLPHSSWAAQRPNIIVLLSDDMGYECIGANGCTSYQTPNIDKLAASGVRFEHCYAQPVCTPTRVQLMTGIYNVRNYTDFGVMDPKCVTFANLLKQSGYATCISGQWQLGDCGSINLPRRGISKSPNHETPLP